MCGISVIVNTKDAPVQDKLVRSMNARIAHRGPDNDGIYRGGNFAIGHRRLSILDTGHLAHQPFQYRDYIITFNGEIYNHCELRKQLIAKGYTFTTRSDTEVILVAYDCWGTQCVNYFEGMWSFVVYDPKKKILFGSRDRYGLKPFYYSTFANLFVIASEVKQYMELPGFKPVLNEQVAFNFLNYGALNYSDETFFQGVQSLGAGHNLVYNLSTHRHSISRWYYFPEGKTNKLDMQEAADEFRRLFRESVATRLSSDVPVAACLSGGLDSSSIVSMARSLMTSGSDFLTLSICWNDKAIDERHYIEEVVRHSGVANKKIFPDMNELNRDEIFEKIIYHQDQPIPSASHFAEYKVYEGAAQAGFPVLLDGQGADEYLGGYGIFNWFHLHGLLSQGRFVSFSREWSAVRRQSNFSDNQMLRMFLYMKYKLGRPLISSFINESWHPAVQGGNPQLPPAGIKLNAKNLSFNQIFTSSLPYQLHSADRNSMCHSVESRLPFLDHRLVEFCYMLPDTLKISNGLSKIVLREGLKSILPPEIYQRKTKLGFPAPEIQWMHQNAQWILKQFDDNAEALSEFVSPAEAKSGFMKVSWAGKGDHSPYFRMLSFAKWLSMFNVSTAAFNRVVHTVTNFGKANIASLLILVSGNSASVTDSVRSMIQ